MIYPRDFLHRRFYLHYRLVREAIMAAVMVGAALLFSYLILQGHF
jgi:hypothetical protein